jgi:purine-cytosine permease-like protein
MSSRRHRDVAVVIGIFVVGIVLMYVAIFGVSVWSTDARDLLVTWSVWARVGTFLLLLIAFLRAPSAVADALDGAETAKESALAD